MGHVLKSLLGMGLAAVAALSMAATVEAASCKGQRCKGPRTEEPGVYRYIYVESDYGPRRASAPVRHSALGDQVKIPGGTWVDCEITCEYTLRRLSVDFWEDQGRHVASPGYLRYDIDIDTGRVHRRYP